MTKEERANDYAEHNIDKYTNEYANIYNAYLKGAEEETKELEAQIEKMKRCLNKWYNQHNTDDYTEIFYDNLLRDTEKCLWGDSVK